MSPIPRLQPDSLADSNFDLTPELETMFNALALAARDDPDARNALYGRLRGKIARFLAPWYARQTALGEFGDLQQEAFVVFADLVRGWSGEGSFARYFFGFFPWRLRHAVAYHERRWPRRRLLIVPEEDLEVLVRREGEPGEDGALPLGALNERQQALLALRLAGYTLAEAAGRLGCCERTAARHWREVRRRLGGSGVNG
jgi:DNA-directed RNA polymerase specialized sigma24 family protein